MRDVPNWLVPAAAVGVMLYAINKLKFSGKQAGEAISKSVFDFLHPSMRPANYNKATAVPAQMVAGAYSCPKGYSLKQLPSAQQKGYEGTAYWCFRED